MLDCGLDASSLTYFLPCSFPSNNFKIPLKPVNASGAVIQGLKACDGGIFIDGIPEFSAPETGMIDMSEVDVILLSNCNCMLALPYVTQCLGFKGMVLCTEPTLHIGRLYMEEIVEYLEKIPKLNRSSAWKDPSLSKFLSLNLQEVLPTARSWKQCFSASSIQDAIRRVDIVAFNESKEVFGGLRVTAISSGYCIGSSNWIIQTACEKIVYLSASSTLTTHPKPMEQVPLKSSDILILSCLTQTPLSNPDSMIGDFCINAAMTLKNGGNVLVPCYPSGVIYDLFECLSGHLDSCGLSSVPMYFISPIANSSLAYSNIYAEWLSVVKQSKIYLPEAPFPHSELVKTNRLRHFSSISDGFYNEMRIPCVVFTGHPSLRFGDVVHFMGLWSKSPQNTIIFTVPDFSFTEALAPYQPVSMKICHCPIDTSLSFAQANKLIRDLNPRHLIVPNQYTVPPLLHPQRSDLTIDSDLSPIVCYKNDVLKLPMERKYQQIEMVPELANMVTPQEVSPGIGVSLVTGCLTTKDSKYVMQVPSDKEWDRKKIGSLAKPYTYGALDIQEFIKCLKQHGIHSKAEEGKNGQIIIELPHDDTLITVENNSTHVFGQANDELHRKIKDSLLQCLAKLS